jgi:hypothetical protein
MSSFFVVGNYPTAYLYNLCCIICIIMSNLPAGVGKRIMNDQMLVLQFKQLLYKYNYKAITTSFKKWKSAK